MKKHKSKKASSLEDDGIEGLRNTGKGALDPADPFNPQEYDMTGVQEDSGQSQTTKELDESREVETARNSRSTKELDGLGERDTTEQVMEDVFKEEKDDRDENDKKLVKKEVSKRGTWLRWCKKQ